MHRILRVFLYVSKNTKCGQRNQFGSQACIISFIPISNQREALDSFHLCFLFKRDLMQSPRLLLLAGSLLDVFPATVVDFDTVMTRP